MAASVVVVVPLFNKATLVGRALKSVLAQTFTDFEVIVVDDGSTDESYDVVCRFSDPRIRVVRQDNGGPGAARNRGVRESCADLLTFLDADDEWMPEFLERSVGVLNNYKDCSFSVFGFYFGEEKTSRNDFADLFHGRPGPWTVSEHWNPKQLKQAVNACHSSSTACRRAVFENHGGFFDQERCTWGEDYFLWLRVMLNHQGYYDPEALSWYHTEASDLYLGRKDIHPPEPAVRYPNLILDVCPAHLQGLTKRLLYRDAVRAAVRLAGAGQQTEAKALLKTYPFRFEADWRLIVDRAIARYPFARHMWKRVRRLYQRHNRHGRR